MIDLHNFTILFPNGKSRRYNIDDFIMFGTVRELEHKYENIIINMDDYCKSFSYEVDKFGEMVNKEPITISQGNNADKKSVTLRLHT